MKAILIDPAKRTVSEVDIKKGSLKDIYKTLECSTFECPVSYPNGDTMYCDEEAWLTYDEEDTGFMFPDWSYAFLGKALIIGCTKGGNDADCKSKISDFKNIIWKSETQMYLQGRKMGLII